MINRLATNVGTGTGTTNTVDLDTRSLSELTIVWKLNGTVTPADLTVAVHPYDELGTRVGVDLPQIAKTDPASDGANVVAARTYDVGGIEKVQVRSTNNNAGSLNINVLAYGSYRGQA